MEVIATYFLFIAALSGYRGSKYWPGQALCPVWLKSPWIGAAAGLCAAALLVAGNGWTSGLLVAFCAYTTVLSCILLTATYGPGTWLTFLILFHLGCLSSLVC